MRDTDGKVRVLRIIARMNVGGPALQIVGITMHLNQTIFEQKLVTGFCEEGEIDLLEAQNIQIDCVRVPGLGRSVGLIKDFKSFLQIRKIMKDFSPEIVHTHTAKAGVIGRLASLTLGSKHIRIHTFHGHLLHGYFSDFLTRLLVFLERFFAKYTHVLISVGRKVRDDLIARGIGDLNKFRVVNPGLELRELKDKFWARQQLNLNQDVLYFAWIGRVVDIKKPFRLIEIAELARDRNLPVRFLIAGDGPLRKEFQLQAIEKKLPIDFLGWQLDIELTLSACDAVILTSENEGTPLSLIQAGMAGIPAIATSVGSVSEVVMHQVTGFVEEYSPEKFIARIEELARDPKLREMMGAAGKDNAKAKFSVERLTRDHESIYLDAVKRAN